MDWCQSPIPEAIQTAKIKGVMFLVYVYGRDDQSKWMNAVWDNEIVCSWIKETGAIAVRIQSSSEECRFFSQIYPVVCVPSTYCIGDGGIPLEVIGGHKTPEEIVDKLKTAQENHESRRKNSASSGETGSVQESMEVSESPPMEETSPSTTSEVTAPGLAGSSNLQTGPSGDKAESLTHSEKIERAKDLIVKKQAEKAQKEFEKSREEEITRRKLGKDMHKLKQTQQEMQMKEMKEQMKKDKEEERKAREKIRAQIAKDREERASRFKKEKEEREVEMEQVKKAKLVEQRKQAAEAEAKKSETARIQVRLPDGSSFTQTFQSTETLQSLCNIVSQKMGGTVSLSTTFPKRVFSEEDMNRTFTDLQLSPSAVIMALPQQRSGPRSSLAESSSFGGFLAMLLYPFTLLWSFLYSMLFGGSTGNQSDQQQQQQESSQDGSSSQPSTRLQRPNTAYQRRINTSRPEGNMRRLADMRDDDDDMTTYNGNSTQQL